MIAEMGSSEEWRVAPERLPIPSSAEYQDGLFGVYAMLNVLREDMARQAEALAKHEANVNRALRGDNNGERGLNWRMAEMERDQKRLSDQLGRIETAINTRGTETTRGAFSIGQAVVTGFFILCAAVIGYLAKGR